LAEQTMTAAVTEIMIP